MGYLARVGGGPATAPRIADDLSVSRDHLSKILQHLVKVGLVSSQRGPRGGFTLARAAEDVTLLELVEAIEGPWKMPRCVFGDCGCQGICAVNAITQRLHEDIHSTLATTTLATLPPLDDR